ncbi:MAG TPA: hypothetical protein VJN18_03940 [Polyangiaceae bacterium]|nr:hypothetical protein [Polyangiaceae bacterium]
MTDALAAAIEALYRAPHGDFVAERKRLAAEAKAAGHAAVASQIGKLGRPSVSAWAVNQLWWQERETFEALVDAAQRVKRGDREAGKQHRELLVELREKGAELLKAAGNAATEPTLRRVTTTLSALAASGGFAPDPEGALVADRDPPGFEAFEGAVGTVSQSTEKSRDVATERAEAAEKRRAEQEEHERRNARREKLSVTLRETKELRDSQQRELGRLRGELENAERSLKKTQALIAELQQQLANL